MNLIVKWFMFALVIMFAAWIIPGIEVGGFTAALLVAVVLALINAFVRPILQAITLPINVLTLGFFSLILNALLLMFAGHVTPGFEVNGFLSAFFGAIIISLLSMGIEQVENNL